MVLYFDNPFKVRRVEVGATIQTDELAPEHLHVRVKCDDCLIASNRHDVHGLTLDVGQQQLDEKR